MAASDAATGVLEKLSFESATQRTERSNDPNSCTRSRGRSKEKSFVSASLSLPLSLCLCLCFCFCLCLSHLCLDVCPSTGPPICLSIYFYVSLFACSA